MSASHAVGWIEFTPPRWQLVQDGPLPATPSKLAPWQFPFEQPLVPFAFTYNECL